MEDGWKLAITCELFQILIKWHACESQIIKYPGCSNKLKWTLEKDNSELVYLRVLFYSFALSLGVT